MGRGAYFVIPSGARDRVGGASEHRDSLACLCRSLAPLGVTKRCYPRKNPTPSRMTVGGASCPPSNSRYRTAYPSRCSLGTITRLHDAIGSTSSWRPCETKIRGAPTRRAGMRNPGENASTWENRSPLARPSARA